MPSKNNRLSNCRTCSGSGTSLFLTHLTLSTSNPCMKRIYSCYILNCMYLCITINLLLLLLLLLFSLALLLLLWLFEQKSIITSKIHNSKNNNLGPFDLEALRQSPWLTKTFEVPTPQVFTYCSIFCS